MIWNGVVLLTALHLCPLIRLSDGQKYWPHHDSSFVRPRDQLKLSTGRDAAVIKGPHSNRTDDSHISISGLEPLATCGRRLGGSSGKRQRDRFDKSGNQTSSGLGIDRNSTKSHDALQISSSELAEPGEFPSYALIIVGDDWAHSTDNRKFPCGGALIGPQLVLTAAHCVERAHEDQIRVILGLNSPNQAAKETHLAVRFCFPEDACDRDKDFLDFALLKLQSPVKYSTFIQPACLDPSDGVVRFSYTNRFQFVGMGVTETSRYSKGGLRKATFARACGEKWQEDYRWMRRTVGCYLPRKISQPCLMDFGGPMYTVGWHAELLGRAVVVAVSSFNADSICESKPMKPSYFMEVYRIRVELNLAMKNCTERSYVNRRYYADRCFRPKKRKDFLNPLVNYDELEYRRSPSKKKYKPSDDMQNQFMVMHGAEPLDTCGRTVIPPADDVPADTDPQRIAADESSDRWSYPGEFPSYVQLGYDESPEGVLSRCGGTLIGPQLIITSAQCTHAAYNRTLYVWLNSNDTSLDLKDLPRVEAYQVCLYRKWCSEYPLYNDVSFVKLKHPVKYHANLQPACFVPNLESNQKDQHRPHFESPSMVYLKHGLLNRYTHLKEAKLKTYIFRDIVKYAGFQKNIVINNQSHELDCAEKNPLRDDYPWCFIAPHYCAVDIGSPLYYRPEALRYRQAVVGLSRVENSLPREAPDKCLLQRGLIERGRKLFPTTRYSDFYQLRDKFELILANCKSPIDLDPDEHQDFCHQSPGYLRPNPEV